MTDNTITLSEDQEAASQAFFKFLANPDESVFVLSGGAGCGKSTLVRHLLEKLPNYFKLMKSLAPDFQEYTTLLTATTNKACEALAQLTKDEVVTIHSFLKLVVKTNYSTRKSELVQKSDLIHRGYLVFVDEASYVDHKLKRIIESRFSQSKIVYIGDADQRIPVGCSEAPVFKANHPKAELSKVVRQAEGNPIIQLATMFRKAVRTGEYGSITPDDQFIVHCEQDEFEERIVKEFNRDDWSCYDSRVLLWTNQGAIDYNNAIRKEIQGEPKFKAGDYALCNRYVPGNKNVSSLKADSTVFIQEIFEPAINIFGVWGHTINIGNSTYFLPNNRADVEATKKVLHAQGSFNDLESIDSWWVDLRAMYASTIDKSQGSTFNKVFIDLNDLRRCYNGNTLARLLYVGVSRARHQVILTGDFV